MAEDSHANRARWWRKRVVGSGALLVLVAAAFVVSVIARGPGESVTLVETRSANIGLDRFVGGALRNNTDEPLDRVRLEITLLDAGGGAVETVTASILNLGAGETREFEAPISAPTAVRFRVDGLACSRSSESPAQPDEPVCSLPEARERAPYAGDL